MKKAEYRYNWKHKRWDMKVYRHMTSQFQWVAYHGSGWYHTTWSDAVWA